MILAQQSHTPAGSTRQFCPIVLTQAISCHRWYPVSSFPNDTHLGNLRPLVAVLDKFFPNSTCSGYISPPWTVFGNFCPNGTCPDDIKYCIYVKILSSFCRNYTHTSNNESYVDSIIIQLHCKTSRWPYRNESICLLVGLYIALWCNYNDLYLF